jgi:PiT family inorganic phosphate transporter
LVATFIVLVAVIVGLYMAWNIGANDVANAMGTSVGSGALTVRRAIILAGIFEFSGAFFVGGNVAQTIRKGIVNIEVLRCADPAARPAPAGASSRPAAPAFAPAGASSRPAAEFHPAASRPAAAEGEASLRKRLMVGMLSALLAAALWLNVATFFAQPVSTTHAIVGAVVGFAVVAAGPACVVWAKMGQIGASWALSPVVGASLAFVVYRLIQKYVLRARHPVFMAKRAVPICFGSVAAILGLSILYKVIRLEKSTIYVAVPLAAVFGMAVALVARAVLLRRTARLRYRFKDRYRVVEKWFGRIQPISACYMAFAHGANDVANAIGPLAGVFHWARGGDIASKAPVPLWLLALGGVGIVVGLGTYGYKVMEAIGKKITEITPTRGFSAEFGTASTVLVCSLMGLPISTTLVLVGAVMGVGLARGFGAIDLRVIRRIFASWLVTIPVSAVFAAVIYWLLMGLV